LDFITAAAFASCTLSASAFAALVVLDSHNKWRRLLHLGLSICSALFAVVYLGVLAGHLNSQEVGVLYLRPLTIVLFGLLCGMGIALTALLRKK
jgi:hypothetical protein